jgi:predicted 3-demethylubiquinone-9 3-methyltransferase (glyoxalase superfamily)
MAFVQKITPCLWFDNQAEDAARFYITIGTGCAKAATNGRSNAAGRRTNTASRGKSFRPPCSK